MAIKLDAANTHVVLTALHIYREQEMEGDADKQLIEQIERLIKSYRRSFTSLATMEKI